MFETKPLPRKDNNATGKLFSCNFSCMSHFRVNCYVDSVVFRITFLCSFSLDEETLHASFSLPFAFNAEQDASIRKMERELSIMTSTSILPLCLPRREICVLKLLFTQTFTQS